MTAVSVVIPSFNHARFIARAIDSVVTQGHRDFELIVVDDGSTDRTRELLTGPYRAVISKLDLGENRGAAAALNRGIEMSDGEWIAILNSDDVYLPHRLERLLAAAAQSGADFLFSDVEMIDDRGALPSTDKTVQSRARATQAARHQDIVSVLSGSQFSVTSSNFFCRKGVVGELGGFRQFRYCHDWDFIIRVIGRFQVHWVDEVLLQYRLHAANTISERNAWHRHVEYSMVFASALCAPDAQEEIAALDLKSLFASREFYPVLVLWLVMECRQKGTEQILAEMARGELARRAQCQFAEMDADFEAQLSLQKIRKFARRVPFRRWFHRG
jgi:glycosyltransferase involved in cell wall biosynthesis